MREAAFWSSVLAVACAVALMGCETGRGINACPYPIDYTQATMNKAADEVDALPPGSVLGTMMADYAQERARLRECHKRG